MFIAGQMACQLTLVVLDVENVFRLVDLHVMWQIAIPVQHVYCSAERQCTRRCINSWCNCFRWGEL